MLPEDLYRAVKRAAADDNRTMGSFVEEALRAALVRRRETAPRGAFSVQPTGAGGLQPGVDLADSAALLDLMEQQ